jgi:hypothetical protein
MNIQTWCKRLLVISVLLTVPLFSHSETLRELNWDELMPEGWEPQSWSTDEWTDESSDELGSQIADALSNMNQMKTPAPTVKTLDKQVVKIPGYILPIKYDEKGVTEFLLVPYLGACIHVPPPPENQMIYIKLKNIYPSSELFEPVWVSGTLRVETSQTEYADAGYSLHNAVAVKYEMDKSNE